MDERRILLIQGHPDGSRPHLNHALADAYAEGARGAGHPLRRVDVAALDFPLLASQHEWEHGSLPPALAAAQRDIGWAEHVVLFFPLWLGDMPARLKGFLEQVARPGFAFSYAAQGGAFTRQGLAGRSARVVVTMGMPAPVYRWYFGAHRVKSLERNILRFVGFAPVQRTLIGMAGQIDAAAAGRHCARMRKLGARAD